MLGHCDLSWKSAISPPLPPRAIVDPLAGGYRRIPVMQIGADIFCDTKIISSEIANISGNQAMAIENCNADIESFVDHSDSAVFMAIVTTSPPAKTIGLLFKLFSPWTALRFIKDRAGVSNTSSLAKVSRTESRMIVQQYIQDINQRLNSSPYLFGESPTIADFSAYHLIWFKNKFDESGFETVQSKLTDWFERMRKLGHGDRTEIAKSDVFTEARDNIPRDIPASMTKDALIGTTVSIKPNDYAKDPVTGKLVGLSDSRWILARESNQFGVVHVHFPRNGFELLAKL